MAQGVSVPLLKYARENRFSVRSAGYEGRKMRTRNLHTQSPIMKDLQIKNYPGFWIAFLNGKEIARSSQSYDDCLSWALKTMKAIYG